MSRISQIRDKIIELLGTIEPSNVIVRPNEPDHTPTWILSTAGQVRAGRYERPVGTPFVCVYFQAKREGWSEQIGTRAQKGTFVVTGWAQETPQDPAVRQLEAESLAADLEAKLRSAPSLEGVVRDFLADVVVFDAVDPQRPDRAVWGACVIEITARWNER